MGQEYRLKFEHAGEEAFLRALRRLSPSPLVDDPSGGFRVHPPDDPGGRPAATLRVEPWGLSVRCHDDRGREFLGGLVKRLVATFGLVTVEEI